MFSRRLSFFLACLLLMGLSNSIGTSTNHAQEQLEAGTEKVASLKTQLEKSLRARRPEEFQFIGTVAAYVDQGKLTKELVQGSFSWTLKRYRNRKTLVPYFEQILRARAAKEGNHFLDTVPSTIPSG